VATHFKKDPHTLELSLRLREDLGGDSLDLVELLFLLEQETGATIPEAHAADIVTLADVVRYVERARG
jgi:acyl carrier protein